MESEHSIKEIVNFINLTPYKTDLNLFERLNSQEFLNVFINCLIYIGKATSYEDFEINDEEEALFACIIRENKALKIMKVTCLLNKLFFHNGYTPSFSPNYIFSPILNIIQSTLSRLLDINNRTEEIKKRYSIMSHDYKDLVESVLQMIKRNEDDTKQGDLLKRAVEEGNQIISELSNDQEDLDNKIKEIDPEYEKYKKFTQELIDKINNKEIDLNKIQEKFNENLNALNQLQEHLISEPDILLKKIESNHVIYNETENISNDDDYYLDNISALTVTFSKILDKVISLKNEVQEGEEIDKKNNELFNTQESIKNNISEYEKLKLNFEEKLKLSDQKIKETDLLIKNKAKEVNNNKMQLDQKKNQNIEENNNRNIRNKHIIDNNPLLEEEINKLNNQIEEIFNFNSLSLNNYSKKYQEIDHYDKILIERVDNSLKQFTDYQNYHYVEEPKNNENEN